jgi:cation transport ATPase
MSERYIPKSEHKETHNAHETHSEALKNKYERELTKAEKEHGSNEELEKIREKIEHQAPLKQEKSHTEKENPAHSHPVIINKQLKDMAFSRSMTRTRKKLSRSSRAFSKVIHNSTIDKSSEFVGKTVARPSGMLTGAFLAFIGTSALLWITRHYGYTYNYLVVIILFVGGMLLGLGLEGLYKTLRKKS